MHNKNMNKESLVLLTKDSLSIQEDARAAIVGQCVMEPEDGATLQIGQEQVQTLLATETIHQIAQFFIKLATKIIALAHAGISEMINISSEQKNFFKIIQLIVFSRMFPHFEVILWFSQ
jgi:hypothetical protein